MVLELGDVTLHVVTTPPSATVLAHELGPEWSTAHGFCAQLRGDSGETDRLKPWTDDEMMAPLASGSHRLIGVVVLPCSAGMVGSLANGISRGLGQRVADVALKQKWPLLVGVRETPMSPILLDNLRRLALAGAYIVPPLPAFYLSPSPENAFEAYWNHYCVRLLDLLGIEVAGSGLRWGE
jgi:4-hydroxy-3-polyprenylbenzoate decarboxylase